MLIDTIGLLSLFDSFYLLPPRGAGIALCSISIFAHCVLGVETLYSLLLVVFRLMLLRTVGANLRRVILSADVAIVVAAEALLYSVCAVVELVLMYLALLRYSGIDYGISYLWICELNNDRGRLFKSSFLG